MATNVVLGLGGGVDYEIKLSTADLELLAGEYQIRAGELCSLISVTSERDLVVSILSHIKKGGGGEHFVVSPAALHAFAGRFDKRVTLGGTSVRAAVAMSRLGVPSTLHLVTVNNSIRRLLPEICDYIGSFGPDTLYPHLIVQYDQHTPVRVGDLDIRAPFANRLIYVNDPANEALLLSDDLGRLLRDARVFLISGFNAVRDEVILDQRLSTLKEHMRQLPSDAIVYYEDAAFHRPALNRRLRAALVDAIDIYGLNEDEMQAHLGGTVDLLSVAEVERALKALQALIPAPSLVLHTRYWSAAIGERAAEYAKPLDNGIVLASTRYSYGDEHTDQQYEFMRGRPRRPEGVEFAAALEDRMGGVVRCVPGLRLDVPEPTTIGLGDTFVGGFLATICKRADPVT